MDNAQIALLFSFKELFRCNIFANHLDINSFVGKFTNHRHVLLSVLSNLLCHQFVVSLLGHSGFTFATISSCFIKLFSLMGVQKY